MKPQLRKHYVSKKLIHPLSAPKRAFYGPKMPFLGLLKIANLIFKDWNDLKLLANV